MSNGNRQTKREDKKRDTEIHRAALENVRSLRAKGLIHGAAAERRAESVLSRALHEHEQNKEGAHDDLKKHEYIIKDVPHKKGFAV